MSHNLSDGMQWFRDCEIDNSREFWALNRERYLRAVREPVLNLLEATGEEAAQWRIYKPHRDTRFAPDAPPLKTFIGALRVSPDGTGRYLQLDARGILASSGLPYFAPDQLPRWRSAVVEVPGLDAAIAAARSAQCTLKSGYPAPLKRVPRGFDPEHRHADYLRWKGIEALRRDHDSSDVYAEWLIESWQGGEQLCRWLASAVGPSSLQRR
jgi:uncharacterized protein (DUF2461 family)